IPVPSTRLSEQESAQTELFVTPVEAAAFLRCAPVTVKRLAREGKIPAHSVHNGIRKRWRFLISELAISMKKEVSSDRSSTPLSQPKERGKAV
ncbi:MAG TPA: helix-turn-helix domain-containing protein, partial [Edaphobacter sp.]|nr:helix-turn-helix domain-containing protein [Edaphobacter sp.]